MILEVATMKTVKQLKTIGTQVQNPFYYYAKKNLKGQKNVETVLQIVIQISCPKGLQLRTNFAPTVDDDNTAEGRKGGKRGQTNCNLFVD